MTIKELREKIENIDTKSIVSTEMKAFVKLVLEIANKNKEELAKLSNENIKTIQNAVDFIEAENAKLLKGVSRETSKAKEAFKDKLKELNKLISELKSIKYKDGVDGKKGKDGKDGRNPTPYEIVPLVLKQIPELKPEDIADKLEELKGDKRLDKSAIKGIEDLEKQISSRPVISGGLTQAKVSQLLENYIIGDGVAKLTVGTTEPTSPSVGDLWYDTN